MAPVVAKSQQAISSSAEEIKSMQQANVNVTSPKLSSPHSAIDFPECAIDHEAKISPDEEIIERPTRAYSIGSRNEHTRLFKQHTGGGFNSNIGGGGGGNNLSDAEPCNVRVRAFSVGSRAKIPRCELQRNVLSPKILFEQQQKLRENHCPSNCSSNNNISANTTQLSSSASSTSTHNQLMHLYAHRDKKSSSAPLLLLHKSQNSVDRMSDLMEIDFSIKYNSNSTNSRINLNTTSPNTSIAAQPTSVTVATTSPAALNKTYYTKNVLNNTTTTTAAVVTANTTNITTSTTTTITLPSSSSSATTSTITTAVTTNVIANNNNSDNCMRNYYPTTTNYIKQTQQQQSQTMSTTDNGYLEMKPVGSTPLTTFPPVTTSQIKKQQQRKKHTTSNEHLPKTMSKTLIPTNNEHIMMYDDKSNKNQSHQNLNANITNELIPVVTTNTVLTNNKHHQQHQQQQQQQQEQSIEMINANTLNTIKPQTTTITNTNTITTPITKTTLAADNNDNHNNVLEHHILLNEDKKHQLTNNIMNDLDNNSKITIKQDNKQQQQQKQQHNNIVIDDYANMESKFDAYMTLNPNTIINNNDKTQTAISTALSSLTTNAVPKIHENERIVDEQQNNTIILQQQQHQPQLKLNKKHADTTNNFVVRNNVLDTGYELLQIKSDKSLNQRSITAGNVNVNLNANLQNNKKDNNNKLPILTTRPNSTNSAILYNSSSTLAATPAINYQSQPLTPTTTTITNTITTNNDSVGCITIIPNNTKATPPPTSRPSSVNLETREILYADLDWPQCSQEAMKTVTPKPTAITDTGGGGGGGVALSMLCANSVGVGGIVNQNETVLLSSTPSVHNVYAKIDFDHSDSSSSSSKNI